MAGEQRRAQLLDVTAELVLEQGFHAVSIQSVARRAGITRPIVYEHFGDLNGLLTALIQREGGRALDQVRATRLRDLTTGEPIELMIESLRTYLTAVEGNPTTWRLVLLPPEGAPELLRTSIADGRSAVLADLIDAVAPSLEPDIDGSDSELTARLLSTMADEYARLVLCDPVRYAPQRLLRHARWFLKAHARPSSPPRAPSARGGQHRRRRA
jgi:AcrR family transcriptional regulator